MMDGRGDYGGLPAESWREEIAGEFRRAGFLPASQQLLLRGDPAFSLRRRLRVFRTTPHLRLPLLAGWVVNLVAGRDRPSRGRALPIDGRAALAGDGNTFYFNGLILELLDLLRAGAQPSAAEAAMEEAMVREFEEDFIAYPQGGGEVKAWGYFPRRHPRFEAGKPLLKLLAKWGADAADLDSTSMVLCRLLRRGSPAAPAEAALRLLEEHVFGEGRWGREELAYDNGVDPEDRGILLWVQEKHNELDAGVNVNLACLLAVLLGCLDAPGRERAFRLARGVFRFLGHHAERGSYGKAEFLLYYPPESLAFLWLRLDHARASLPPSDRERFDPEDVTGRLGRHLADLLAARVRDGAGALNAFDRLLALPLLLRLGRDFPPDWLAPAALNAAVEAASATAHAFGKFVYPLRLVYGCRALGRCAGLLVLREAERAGYPLAGLPAARGA